MQRRPARRRKRCVLGVTSMLCTFTSKKPRLGSVMLAKEGEKTQGFGCTLALKGSQCCNVMLAWEAREVLVIKCIISFRRTRHLSPFFRGMLVKLRLCVHHSIELAMTRLCYACIGRRGFSCTQTRVALLTKGFDVLPLNDCMTVFDCNENIPLWDAGSWTQEHWNEGVGNQTLKKSVLFACQNG